MDEVGGRKPFLILLGRTLAGMAGLVNLLFLYYPADFGADFLPALLVFGVLGAPAEQRSSRDSSNVILVSFPPAGYALGVYAGAGNVAPELFSFIIPMLIGLWV